MYGKQKLATVLFSVFFACVFLSFHLSESLDDFPPDDMGTKQMICADDTSSVESCDTLSLRGVVRSGHGTAVFRGNRMKTSSWRLTILCSLFFVSLPGLFQWKSLKKMYGVFLNSSLFLPVRFLRSLMIQKRKDGKKRMIPACAL